MAFSCDGRILAFGESFGDVLYWGIARACSYAGCNLTLADWQQFFGLQAYRPPCVQWPVGN